MKSPLFDDLFLDSDNFVDEPAPRKKRATGPRVRKPNPHGCLDSGKKRVISRAQKLVSFGHTVILSIFVVCAVLSEHIRL